LPHFFHSITIAKQGDWERFFDPERGLFKDDGKDGDGRIRWSWVKEMRVVDSHWMVAVRKPDVYYSEQEERPREYRDGQGWGRNPWYLAPLRFPSWRVLPRLCFLEPFSLSLDKTTRLQTLNGALALARSRPFNPIRPGMDSVELACKVEAENVHRSLLIDTRPLHLELPSSSMSWFIAYPSIRTPLPSLCHQLPPLMTIFYVQPGSLEYEFFLLECALSLVPERTRPRLEIVATEAMTKEDFPTGFSGSVQFVCENRHRWLWGSERGEGCCTEGCW
jgi:hypothetical protein